MSLPPFVLPPWPPPHNVLLPPAARFYIRTPFPSNRTIRQGNPLCGNTPTKPSVRMTLCRCKRTIGFTLRFKCVLTMAVYEGECFRAGFLFLTVSSSDQGDVSVVAAGSFEMTAVRVGNAVGTAHGFLAVGMLAGFRWTRFLKGRKLLIVTCVILKKICFL